MRTCTYGLSARSGRRQMKPRPAAPTCSPPSQQGTEVASGLTKDRVISSQWHNMPEPPEDHSSVNVNISPELQMSTQLPPAAMQSPVDDCLSTNLADASQPHGLPDTTFPSSATVYQANDMTFYDPEPQTSASDALWATYGVTMPVPETSWCSPFQETSSTQSPSSDESIFDDVIIPDSTTATSPSIFTADSQISPAGTMEDLFCDPSTTMPGDIFPSSTSEGSQSPAESATTTHSTTTTSTSSSTTRSKCACTARILNILNTQRSRSRFAKKADQLDAAGLNRTLLDATNTALDCGCVSRDQRLCNLLICTAMDMVARACQRPQQGDEQNTTGSELGGVLNFVNALSQRLRRCEGSFVQWHDSPFVNFWKATDHY
jgi:hypothetical protein